MRLDPALRRFGDGVIFALFSISVICLEKDSDGGKKIFVSYLDNKKDSASFLKNES